MLRGKEWAVKWACGAEISPLEIKSGLNPYPKVLSRTPFHTFYPSGFKTLAYQYPHGTISECGDGRLHRVRQSQIKSSMDASIGVVDLKSCLIMLLSRSFTLHRKLDWETLNDPSNPPSKLSWDFEQMQSVIVPSETVQTVHSHLGYVGKHHVLTK